MRVFLLYSLVRFIICVKLFGKKIKEEEMKCVFYIVLGILSFLFEKYFCKKDEYIFNFKIILVEIRIRNFL